MKTYKISINLLILTLFSVLIISCKGQQGDIGPIGPPGPNLKGDIIGYIKTIDYNGNQLSDASGTTIKIDSSQNTFLTGSDGKFIFSNIVTGTYNFSLTRPNYGNHKIISFQHLGGAPSYLGIMNYYQIPLFTISNFSASTISSNINISGSITGQLPTTTRYIRIFVNNSSPVTNNPLNYVFSVLTTASSSSTSFNTSISQSTLRNYGIIQGIPLYLVAYPEAYSGGNSYIDINTGKYFYISVNPVPSSTIAVIAP